MNYMRVIPRDLFNEGNLMKCYGQLYLMLEYLGMEKCLHNNLADEEGFCILQSPDDGSTRIINVALIINDREIELFRPLNSRKPFPLQALINEEYMNVFYDCGEFTAEFLAFLKEAMP